MEETKVRLKAEVVVWDAMPGHERFYSFIRGVEVTNAAAERSIKLCQDHIKTARKEEVFQNRVQTATAVRKIVRGETKKGKKADVKKVPIGS